jgi:glucokinase
MILAGDIGGTKCNLALFKESEADFQPILEKTLASRDFPSLKAVAAKFLEEEEAKRLADTITFGCFGIAGPVVRQRCKTPNLPWTVTATELESNLGVKVVLLNDLEATGFGVLTLGKHQVQTLNQGNPVPTGHLALIAAGTGLGEALLIRTSKEFLPVASEGGHGDFAPRNQLEMELLAYSMKTWDHVSYERVLSGPGLHQIYSFLKESGHGKVSPQQLRDIEESGDASASISAAALSNSCPVCVKALDLFVSIYGAEAGNLALKAKTTGGVYLGGGIAPKILAKLSDGTFFEAFCDKGRMEPLLRSIPVHVILEPKTALNGAVYFARSRA